MDAPELEPANFTGRSIGGWTWATLSLKAAAPTMSSSSVPRQRNCSDLRGSADDSAYCKGATEHGISTANRFRPLKREQLPDNQVIDIRGAGWFGA